MEQIDSTIKTLLDQKNPNKSKKTQPILTTKTLYSLLATPHIRTHVK